MATLTTPFTKLMGIQHPIVLAGMAFTSYGKLAAAVSNAGGLGVIGAMKLSPDQLRDVVAELKANLKSANLPFGIDLALPQVGGDARKTNYDYTEGKLEELIDVVIDSGARLFVCAIGIPPKRIVDKLHKNNVFVANMVGHPKHADKALSRGVDIVIAQGTEGGGHSGEIATSVLVPAVVDIARKYRPDMLKGSNAIVLAAGGICNGRGLAAALMQGASAVWVGTRFIASVEANSDEAHKKAVVESTWDEPKKTLVLTGRPLRARPNDYIRTWHARPQELRALLDKGVVPYEDDVEKGRYADFPDVFGQAAGSVNFIQPAADIVRDMVREAVEMVKLGSQYLAEGSKL